MNDDDGGMGELIQSVGRDSPYQASGRSEWLIGVSGYAVSRSSIIENIIFIESICKEKSYIRDKQGLS